MQQKLNWSDALSGVLLPRITWSNEYFTTLVAILGTTISPYLFFWQASQEAEDVHVDRRSMLRLDDNDQSTLAADFQRVFHDSGFELRPLDSGDFLVLGPQMPHVETLEPARSMGASIAFLHPKDTGGVLTELVQAVPFTGH